MSEIRARVEKGTCRKDIRKSKGLIPKRLLEDLIFGDYLDYLFWLIVTVEEGSTETGTFKEFLERDFFNKNASRSKDK